LQAQFACLNMPYAGSQPAEAETFEAWVQRARLPLQELGPVAHDQLLVRSSAAAFALHNSEHGHRFLGGWSELLEHDDCQMSCPCRSCTTKPRRQRTYVTHWRR
jgi:hypothetical protein